MSDGVWRLFWRDRPVCVLRAVGLYEHTFMGARFDPAEFPKDLADALARALWERDHDDPDEEDGTDDPGPSVSYSIGWSVLEPNGTRHDPSFGSVSVDFINGFLSWR